MSLTAIVVLLLVCAVLLVLERRGVRTTLSLSFKGDLKRESAFLAQYGQSVATPIAAALAYSFTRDLRQALAIVAAVAGASVVAFALKRLTGRMRPNRDNAGRFTGPFLRHDNARESFPSSHSACAIALTASLVFFFPQAAIVLWILAITCALLRWMLDAHFPSDVAAGLAVGYGAAYGVLAAFGYAVGIGW